MIEKDAALLLDIVEVEELELKIAPDSGSVPIIE